MQAGKRRDQQKAEYKFGKLCPQELGFVLLEFGGPACGPAQGESKHDEPDHGVPRGLRQHRELLRGIGVNRTGRDRFCGIVHGQARPQSKRMVRHAERMPYEGESEERDGAQSENRSNSKRGIFIVSLDCALRGDDGGDSANRRSHG